MIDTRCQVTIMATSVFERMCASDPRVRSRLRLFDSDVGCLVALAEPVRPGEVYKTLPSGRHCNGVPPLAGGGRSAVAQEPSPSVRTCFPDARRTFYRTYHIGTA